ncbi:hypothetical protein [Pseudarthrobacter sp. NS4]|uniref:hypothetical protein n=1 Tax=Pseudarthrobacter sp. NS4 TaxID=2973976 RepID=UPI00216121AB|nr:hypothetical protein [Pseudarthrobacter sp. NS4]
MNRHDSGPSDSPDQGSNHDDAVWLDLVARLESEPPFTEPRARTTDPRSGTTEPGVTAEPGIPAARPGQGASFRDFDPLGLASAAPTELSAADREASRTAGASARGADADGPPAGPRDYEVDDDEGTFVPEEPPSLAGTDPLTMLAWLAAVGGPVALLLSAMFWRSAPLLAVLGIVAAFVLGTVYLIMKLPQEKDEDDDGARV